MRRATLGLIVAGVMLAGVAGWLSWVLPLRASKVRNGDGFPPRTQTIFRNVWGFGLWMRYEDIQGYKGEAVEELIMEGPMLDNLHHGVWTVRKRNAEDMWTTSTHWFVLGKPATEQEWNEYSRWW